MTYIDGFIAAVPKNKREAYIKVAQIGAEVFKENGATQVTECWGDDIAEGDQTSFTRAVKCQADEQVVFSWITWPSKDVRDEGMKKSMADPRLDPSTTPMPFDINRLIFGGFEVIVNK